MTVGALQRCACCEAATPRVRLDWCSAWCECRTCGYRTPALPRAGLSVPAAVALVVIAWNHAAVAP